MYRTGRAASLGRLSLHYASPATTRNTSSLRRPLSQNQQCLRAFNRKPSRLALTLHKPLSTSLQRYAGPYDKIDVKHEDKIEHERLPVQPEEVSTTSSVHQVFHEKGVDDPQDEEDMMAGIKSDMRTIRDTFALNEVPREALYIGLAGVLPYLITSASTVYLAFDINHASETGTHFLFPPHTAELMLHIIEPLQVGYGAVILSFLGAIHWGLEWAKFGGTHGYRRYAYGVVAPAVAWPTILFPVEYALITQFCAFCFLYYADARSVVKGWSPHWYSTYRFVLTFVVGASIVLSLIGRGQIADQINKLPSPADRVKALRDMQLDAMEAEEREKQAKAIARDEGLEDEDEDEDKEEEEEEEEE